MNQCTYVSSIDVFIHLYVYIYIHNIWIYVYLSVYIYIHYNIASLEYVTLHYVTLHYIHTIVPSNNHNEPNCTRQFANEQNPEGRKVMGTTNQSEEPAHWSWKSWQSWRWNADGHCWASTLGNPIINNSHYSPWYSGCTFDSTRSSKVCSPFAFKQGRHHCGRHLASPFAWDYDHPRGLRRWLDKGPRKGGTFGTGQEEIDAGTVGIFFFGIIFFVCKLWVCRKLGVEYPERLRFRETYCKRLSFGAPSDKLRLAIPLENDGKDNMR